MKLEVGKKLVNEKESYEVKEIKIHDAAYSDKIGVKLAGKNGEAWADMRQIKEMIDNGICWVE